MTPYELERELADSHVQKSVDTQKKWIFTGCVAP